MNLAPNGKPSNLTPEQYRLVRTPEFKAWFGDWEKAYETGNYDNVSKVIDEKTKEPLVVYHGSKKEFSVFCDFNKEENIKPIFFFAKNIINSKFYGKNIYTTFLNIRNPKIYIESFDPEIYIDEKFDGVIIKRNKNYDNWYVATESYQIKLADGTNTTFDSNNPDIRYAGGGEILTAPNGKPSNLTPEQYRLVRTPEFKKWFGDWENSPETASKVVDDNGEPKVLFHGTGGLFNKFDEKEKGSRGGLNEKFWSFTSNLEIAKIYAESDRRYSSFSEPRIISVFLDIKEMPTYNNRGRYYRDLEVWGGYKNIDIFQLQDWHDRGFDMGVEFKKVNGFCIKNTIEMEKFNNIINSSNIEKMIGDTYYVRNSTQIKLADGTNTTFDSNNPDIRYAGGGQVLLAPNGKPSNLTPEQYRIVRTPEFKAWFGDWEKAYETGNYDNVSKIIDEETKEPLVVYHGTNFDFTIFKSEKPTIAAYGQGFYFTNDKEFASNYARGQNSKILNLFLNARNIFEIYEDEFPNGYEKYSNMVENKGRSRDFTTKIKSQGYDSVYAKNKYNENEIVIFEPTNIKLADGTNTIFDSNNPDIRFSLGGEIEEYKKQGILDLNFYPTNSKHAKEHGIDAKNPLYLQNLIVKESDRLKFIGKKVLLYLDEYAKQNGNDVIFGYINQKATMTKDNRTGYFTEFTDVDWIKHWLFRNGYCVKRETNNFYKVLDTSAFGSNNPDIRYAGGGSLTDVNVSYANDQQVNELYDLVSKSNELGNVGHPRLVLIQKNKVIGGIFVDNDYLPYEYMFDIFIKNSKRGKGYSKLLLDAMIKDFVENFPEADQIRGWVINKKLEYYLESKYNFWCADDNEEQILYCYLSKKDAEKLLNNKEFKKGGSLSKTPAPKRERIYGSKVNKPKSSESKIKASSIVLSPKVIASINTILEKHNEKSKKKISLSTAKAVVRRGMGAYSSTHRPTIKGGKPNSRVAWGLARLNAFVYKIQKGYSKSGRYTQDDDLINELGYKVKRYEVGGEVLLAPNGKPSNLTPEQYRLVRTPAFKAWFGDWENSPETASKVVDYNGEPLPVYHGTNAEPFEVFYDGSFFTDDYMNADGYASGEMIYEVFLNIKKPLIINAEARKWDNLKNKYGNSTRDIAYELDTDKYDGVIFNNINDNWFDDEMGDTQNVYFSTNANQIKLADGTNTTFDSNNPDIRYEKGGYIRAIKRIYKDGDEYVYGGKFGLNGTINWKYNPKNNYLYLMGIERNTDKSLGEGTKAINYLFELYPKVNKIKFEIDNDEDKNVWKFYYKLGATEEGGGKLNKNSFFAELKREDKNFELGGEITLTSEQVENKLGRKLHWWNDDVVTINGIEYQKVFLRNEYKIK